MSSSEERPASSDASEQHPGGPSPWLPVLALLAIPAALFLWLRPSDPPSSAVDAAPERDAARGASTAALFAAPDARPDARAVLEQPSSASARPLEPAGPSTTLNSLDAAPLDAVAMPPPSRYRGELEVLVSVPRDLRSAYTPRALDAVRAQHGALLRCYQAALDGDANLAGSVAAHLELSDEGAVLAVELRGGLAARGDAGAGVVAGTHECLRGALRAVRFAGWSPPRATGPALDAGPSAAGRERAVDAGAAVAAATDAGAREAGARARADVAAVLLFTRHPER